MKCNARNLRQADKPHRRLGVEILEDRTTVSDGAGPIFALLALANTPPVRFFDAALVYDLSQIRKTTGAWDQEPIASTRAGSGTEPIATQRRDRAFDSSIANPQHHVGIHGPFLLNSDLTGTQASPTGDPLGSTGTGTSRPGLPILAEPALPQPLFSAPGAIFAPSGAGDHGDIWQPASIWASLLSSHAAPQAILGTSTSSGPHAPQFKHPARLGPGNSPIAYPDTYNVHANRSLSVPAAQGVLVNDSPSTGVTAIRINVPGYGPNHGTVTLFADGSFTYIPTPAFVGSDFFTYQNRDGSGNYSNYATVTIYVTDAPPIANNDTYAVSSIPLVVPASTGLLANDVDTDGDTLSVDRSSVTQPPHGTLTAIGTDGSFTYTPTSGYHGSDYFQYRATDGVQDSNLATVVLNVLDPQSKVFLNTLNFTGDGFHVVTADIGNPEPVYQFDQWLDNNADGNATDPGEHQYPVVFKRNTTPEVSALFTVAGGAVGNGPIKVKGTGIGPAAGYTFNKTINGPPGNGFSTGITPFEEVIPNQVGFYRPFLVSWQVSLDNGTTWQFAGTSANEMDITYDLAPLSTPIYHTLAYVGCSGAFGATTADAVVSGIWNQFSGRTVIRTETPVQLTYWLYPPGSPNPTSATDTAGLLNAGDGQCASWAEFLLDMWRAQGVSANNMIQITPNVAGATGFLVKNWAFYGSGSAPSQSPFVYVKDTDVIDQTGVPGQGTTNPYSNFKNHSIALYGSQYYDPSYGTGPFATQQAWENASLDGITKNDGNTFYVKKKDTTVLETTFTTLTY